MIILENTIAPLRKFLTGKAIDERPARSSCATRRARFSLIRQSADAAVLCGCIVAFAYSANYTNHAPLAPALMREFGFNKPWPDF